jgi:uncharacterized membrane protein
VNRSFWRNLLFFIPFVPLLLAGSCVKLDIALAQQTLSVEKGTAAKTVTLNIVRENVNGAMDLTATGIPAGVDIRFKPVSVNVSSSIMSVTANNTATVGSSVITITGTTVGFAPRMTQLALTVTASQTQSKSTITKFTATPNNLSAPGGIVFLSSRSNAKLEHQ